MNITQEAMEAQENKEYIIDHVEKTITVQHNLVDEYWMILKEKYPTYTIQYGILV